MYAFGGACGFSFCYLVAATFYGAGTLWQQRRIFGCGATAALRPWCCCAADALGLSKFLAAERLSALNFSCVLLHCFLTPVFAAACHGFL